MFGRRRSASELDLPPIASDPATSEVLRVWAGPDHPQQLSLRTTWSDPAAWGLLLVDVARHAAKAYAAKGQDEAAALERIRQALAAEWSQATDEPRDIS